MGSWGKGPGRTRRDALGFLLGGTAVLALAGCPRDEQDSVVVLDTFYDSGDGRQAILDAVEVTAVAELVRIGTTSRESFVSSIDDYLDFTPGSVFTWPVGHALSELINGGQVEQVSQAWNAADLNPRLRRLSSDSDGVQFMVPLWFDPVGFFYSATEWADSGYSAPDTAEDLLELAQGMANDGVSAFGLSRLATPALVALFDYLALDAHGVVGYRRSITQSGVDLAEFGADVFPVLQELSAIESALPESAPVSIVPARLSDAATRAGTELELSSFILGTQAVVSHSEGFMMSKTGVDQDLTNQLQLITELAKIGPQQAFLGTGSAILPANLNANYQAMNATMLNMVEIVDRAEDIVESSEVAEPAFLAGLTNQLTELVRPS